MARLEVFPKIEPASHLRPVRPRHARCRPQGRRRPRGCVPSARWTRDAAAPTREGPRRFGGLSRSFSSGASKNRTCDLSIIRTDRARPAVPPAMWSFPKMPCSRPRLGPAEHGPRTPFGTTNRHRFAPASRPPPRRTSPPPSCCPLVASAQSVMPRRTVAAATHRSTYRGSSRTPLEVVGGRPLS